MKEVPNDTASRRGTADAQNVLIELAVRCETERPTWVLDCEIGAAIYNLESPGVVLFQDGIWTINLHGTPLTPIWRPFKPLNYTTSLDAAVTLVPECYQWSATGAATAVVWEDPPRGVASRLFAANAKTPALALCAAALKARAASQPQPPSEKDDRK